MSEFPQWLTMSIALVLPLLGIISFWMALSSRLTKAESAADIASKIVTDNTKILTELSHSYTGFREQVAKEYIHRSTMIEVEDRLSKSIDRLGDRFDIFLTRLTENKP